jgi:tRNA A37 threonylcarbamoyladenosine biosynthesis protein TsaE
MKAILVSSLEELAALAEKVATQLRPGDVLALTGQLAAGKTTLTKQILTAMGYKGSVTSPTFVIEHRYPVKFQRIKEVIHLDLYRLSSGDLKEFDWPEIAAPYLPPHTKVINLKIIDEHTRQLTLPDNLQLRNG